MKAPSLTIGIEEEYQIIDPNTRELRSYITQILEDSKLVLKKSATFQRTGELKNVADQLIRETREGVTQGRPGEEP